jgi:TolA-binding protein
LNEEVKAAQDAVRIAKKFLEDSVSDESDKQMEVGRVHSLYEEAKQVVQTLEDSVSKLSSEVSDLKHLKTTLQKELDTSKLESKKLSVHIDRIVKERANAEKEVSIMLKNYSWIPSEQNAFGIRGGDYDFESSSMNEIGKSLTDMKSEQESLVSFKKNSVCLFYYCSCPA